MLQKLLVRRPGPTQTATRLALAQDVTLTDGTTIRADAGDWIIASGKHALAVVPPAQFPGPYEVVEEGTLILTRAERDRLEVTTGLGTTRTGSELCAAVERLARIRIGEVPIGFTPGQLEELAHRAKKRGQTMAQAVQAVVDRIKDELFHHS